MVTSTKAIGKTTNSAEKGECIFMYILSDIYEGELKDDNRHGQGFFLDHTGKVVNDSEWINGEIQKQYNYSNTRKKKRIIFTGDFNDLSNVFLTKNEFKMMGKTLTLIPNSSRNVKSLPKMCCYDHYDYSCDAIFDT